MFNQCFACSVDAYLSHEKFIFQYTYPYYWKVYITIDKNIHIWYVPYGDVMFPMSIKHVTDIEPGLIFTSIWNEQKEMLSQKQSFYARFYSNRDCKSPSMLSYYHFALNDWIILICILLSVLTVHCINEIQILYEINGKKIYLDTC